MSFTKEIYYAKCSATLNYEYIIDNSIPTICPYHGGSLSNGPIIVGTNRLYSEKIINNYIDYFKENSYTKIITFKLNGIKNAVLREIKIISNKYDNITSYDIRILDIINNKVIMEQNLTNNAVEIITITENNINNLPYDDSIVEIQIRTNGSSDINKNVNINEINFLYEKLI